MPTMKTKLFECYHWAQHLAHSGERPLHMAYFCLVFWESHYTYGIVAAILAVATLFTLREAA